MPGETMTTKKANAQLMDEAPATDAGDSPPTADENATTVFRDKVYTSRTLILSDGSTASVVAGKIEASNDMLLALLTAEPDFEPLPR
jgi:hypothetical protein